MARPRRAGRRRSNGRGHLVERDVPDRRRGVPGQLERQAGLAGASPAARGGSPGGRGPRPRPGHVARRPIRRVDVPGSGPGPVPRSVRRAPGGGRPRPGPSWPPVSRELDPGEDGLLHPAQGVARIEAQVVEQAAPRTRRRHRAPRPGGRPVQDEHQQDPAALAVGLLGRQLPGPGDKLGGPAGIELDDQELLLEALDQLLEPGRDDARLGQVFELRQRPPSAQGQGGPERRPRRPADSARSRASRPSAARRSTSPTSVGVRRT